MILYDFIPAPNPRRVRVFLHEKGIEVPTKQIDIMKGEHKKEDYKKLSPLGEERHIQILLLPRYRN